MRIIKTNSSDYGQYLGFAFRLQGGKLFLCLLHLIPQCLSLLRQSITLASGNVYFRLFRVDLGCPWLKFLLLILNFVVEHLCLV